MIDAYKKMYHKIIEKQLIAQKKRKEIFIQVQFVSSDQF
jgi:hypothetical protein